MPTRHAAAYWREQTKAGDEVKASVINTSSTSGLLGNPGQTNYGAAKAGIAAFTTIAATELARYGVRVNAIAPNARTRMTVETPGLADIVRRPDRRRRRSTAGTRPTSRRWSPTWPPRGARPPARSTSSWAARSACSSPGR